MSACLFPSSLSDLIRQSKRSLFITVMFGHSIGSSSGEAASRLRCSLVGERSSDSESHEAYKTNSGNTLSMCPGHPWLPGSCCACPRMTKKIQGSASATACAQGRPLVKPATACKATKKKKTRCFFTKAAAFSRLTKFIRLSDRSEPEFDASVHSRAVVRG